METWPTRSEGPRFSVVVPVHRVQGYLRECLDSILGQSFRDVEVIAVDDCSPDASGEIIDEVARRDPRVVPVHKETNGGIGAARNTGVERSTGQYILFLDGDDSYAPGALEAIDRRLRETADPEILLYDHVRTYWDGKRQMSAAAQLLRDTGTELFRPADRPEYIGGVFAVVWNRAFRRDFYTGRRLEFTDGLYEDALLVYKAMLSAERVGALGHVCVEYRQRRQGNSMGTAGRKHFSIFAQYERLFAFMDEHPEVNHLRPMLFGKMVDHFLFSLARESRVASGDRAEYFARAHRAYARYVPAGYEPPPGLLGLRIKAIGRGSYPAFQAMKAANRSRKSALGMARTAKREAGKAAYERYYQLRRRQPLDPNLAVFTAYWNRGVSCNPAAVYWKMRELAPHIRGVWVVGPEHRDAVPAGVEYVVARTPRYWDLIARATYFVNNVNFPDHLVKRPGQIHLQTHHGTPLKKMGIDQQPYPVVRMDFEKLLERADRWDYSVSANQHSTEKWEHAYPCAFEALNTGYPRNDVYYRAGEAEVRSARAELGVPDGVKALLYAPTVRDYQRGFTSRLDLARLATELGEDFLLLVRTHYFYGQNEALSRLEQAGRIVDVSRHTSVEQLNLASDALITDYSSIMFDYANLDRPIVAYVDDWEVYERARGVYFDLTSGRPGDSPGVVARTQEELTAAFRSGAWDGERAQQLRTAFRRRFCQWDDGSAAERVVRRVFLGESSGRPAAVPAAERIPAPRPGAAAATPGLGSPV